MTEQTINEQALAFRRLKVQRDRAKKYFDDLDEQLKRAKEDLFSRCEAESVEGLKLDGTNFVPYETPYGTIQDRSAFIEWAEQNDQQLIEPKERKELVNQLVRERLDNGEPLPPGVGYYVKRNIGLRAT